MAVVALVYARGAEIGEGIVVLPADKLPKKSPPVYSVDAVVLAEIGVKEIVVVHDLAFNVKEGDEGELGVELKGAGDVVSVTGDNLFAWSVRSGEGGRRDVLVRPKEMKAGSVCAVRMTTKAKVRDGIVPVLLPGPGDAAGFSLELEISTAAGVRVKVAKADSLVPVEGSAGKRFIAAKAASLEMSVLSDGTGAGGLEIVDPVLAGVVAKDGGSVSFRLDGKIRAREAGASVKLLEGNAAVSGSASGDGWHLVLEPVEGGRVYELVAEREGEFAVSLEIEAPVERKGDWRSLDFRIPGGVIVPVSLKGLEESVVFDRSLPVVPDKVGDLWGGFLPVGGGMRMAWRSSDAVAEGALFFSGTETTDVRVGNGLLRQSTVIDLKVLQGKLPSLSIGIDGPGEVLSVTGEAGLGWSLKEAEGKRTLEISLSRPIEKEGKLRIEAQSALGGFPVKTRAMRFTPAGALRHSGWLRVANEGAVRIEVAETEGLIQLAPAQFPGGVDASLRQVFVHRFPSADYRFSILADQVLPEVGVTEVTVYELAESDRRIHADIELDIREAPLREWELEIPADHAVASVTGAAVADHAVATEERNGRKKLKVIFKEPVTDRQLIAVKLEKNEAAKAGEWELVPLGFPGVKSHRGYVGVAAAAGYRLVPGQAEGTADVPLTFFPKKVTGLQQAFRLKEGVWKAAFRVEALGQSVLADVFHLYSLKAGAAYGSVLVNFFVVGAPSSEWRIEVPAGVGNIDVTGQNVGRDWRREGNVVVVPLSRPVLGAGTLLLTFEQPMSARGGSFLPGEVKPLNVQGERGYVQVVSPLQVDYDVSRSEGSLLKLDPTELPAEFRLLSSAPTLAAWQYTSRDFSLGMDVRWFEPGETAEQVVDFLRLASHISKDGQWVTDAGFFVKTKGRENLRLRMPEKSMLLEAKVDGRAVNVRVDGGETVVPLPAGSDPNSAVEVSLRYGAKAAKAGRPVLLAPVIDAPVVTGEWKVVGDEGRILVPAGGNAEPEESVVPENGWQWMGRNKKEVLILSAGLLAMVFAGRRTGLMRGLGAGLCVLVAGGSLLIAWMGWQAMRDGVADGAVVYVAPAIKAGEAVTVELANVPVWRAYAGWMTWLCVAAAGICLIAGKIGRWKAPGTAGLVLLGAGLLFVRGGAPLFFLAVGVGAMAWWLPEVKRSWDSLWTRRMARAVAVPALMLIGWFGGEAKGEELVAESMVHEWNIDQGRLRGRIEVAVRGEAGDRFLLLGEPAVLSRFSGNGPGLKVVKAGDGKKEAYFVEMETAGYATGTAEFEMPLADPAKGWKVPGGEAVVRRVTVRWNESGWEFFSGEAAKVSAVEDLGANESGAVMVLKPSGEATVAARPRQRDVETEEVRYFAEVTNLFLPGPGVVGGKHRVSIRPSQGRVSSVVARVPQGFTVSDVTDGPVRSWRFDPVKGELRVALEPAQDKAFSFVVETQRGAGVLPVGLELEPMRLSGAAGEVGLLGIGFGEETQAESVETEGLSRINADDFSLGGKEKIAAGAVLHAFRYGADAAKLKVRVAAVAPEVRAESWQIVSLGEDRLLIAADITADITRAGVFRLELEVPEGLEIESATGGSLGHWTESGKGKERTVTLHLSGKTMGRQTFHLTLTGAPVTATPLWTVPRVSVKGASRETGILTVVPERGLQVRAVNRRNVSQMDPRELSLESAKAVSRPGAMVYRLLQGDWSLDLGVSKLDPWVTAKIFHEVTLREGQVLSRVELACRIENAALRTLRVRIPGLDAEAEGTVRATGPAVADFARVAGEEELWEVRFQRGIAGETKVEIEYQRKGGESGSEEIHAIIPEQVRQSSYFVAVRAGGRLEVGAGTLPRGWQRAEWSQVQAASPGAVGGNAPVMVFRVADPEGPLPVTTRRHDLAELRKMRVSSGLLTSLVSPEGDVLTAADFRVETTDKGTIRLQLPPGAGLFNVIVNDEGANLVREGDDWLFHVFPSPDEGRPATLRFVYSAGTAGGTRLEGPRLGMVAENRKLGVPMENLEWRVLVPEGWKLSAGGGDFDLKDSTRAGMFRLEDYRSFAASKREEDAISAEAMLSQANAYLKKGDQERASVAFGNAVKRNLLDEASNEDARVQLRQLKTQQAVLGLNTRRQKLVLDQNAVEGDRGQLEKAAEANPVLRGALNYDPKEFERFTEGNTAEENAALKEIANRIVSQQLAAEPAPAALEVNLPERGKVMVFGRSVQTDGGEAMGIDMRLKKETGGGWWVGAAGCLALGWLARKRGE